MQDNYLRKPIFERFLDLFEDVFGEELKRRQKISVRKQAGDEKSEKKS